MYNKLILLMGIILMAIIVLYRCNKLDTETRTKECMDFCAQIGMVYEYDEGKDDCICK